MNKKSIRVSDDLPFLIDVAKETLLIHWNIENPNHPHEFLPLDSSSGKYHILTIQSKNEH
jgi:hypothetical protein